MCASDTPRAEPLLIGFCVAFLGMGIVPVLAGTATNIDDGYWQWSVPCAIVGTGFLAWLFQWIPIGRRAVSSRSATTGLMFR